VNESRTLAAARLFRGIVCGGAVLAVIALSSGGAAPVRACIFSNVASAYADGVVARHITTLPTTNAGEALWAPFAFPQSLKPGHVVVLREDMGEVARSLGQQALGWRVRWMFGDGATTIGAAATHVYAKDGVYKISVQSYYTGARSVKGWYTFDLIDIVVGPLPASATWLRPARSEPTPAP